MMMMMLMLTMTMTKRRCCWRPAAVVPTRRAPAACTPARAPTRQLRAAAASCGRMAACCRAGWSGLTCGCAVRTSTPSTSFQQASVPTGRALGVVAGSNAARPGRAGWCCCLRLACVDEGLASWLGEAKGTGPTASHCSCCGFKDQATSVEQGGNGAHDLTACAQHTTAPV